ncbi:MAG: 5-(carboxyamino)imidazole ribonucleotide synthase [Actinomycetota bacterium]
MSRPPIVPPATVGVLGGGQLGRYAVLAATVMGYRTVVLDPVAGAPAGVVASEHLVAPYDDEPALRRLAELCDVVTTEFENPPSASLDLLAHELSVAPPPAAVAIAQDRISEKAFLRTNGFPVGPYDVRTDGSPATALEVTGPAVVKTARLGYDGKGQRRVDGPEDVAAAWDDLGQVDCVVESLLELRTELSVLVARTADGRTTSWPVAENAHVDGILDVTVVPAPIDDGLAIRAVELATSVAGALDYVGVLAVELFVVAGDDGDDRLLVNELAPRPHNSGHWTLDACATSQFEQQVRAVCGTGLGPTAMTAPACAMANLLGDLWFDPTGEPAEPDWAAVLDDPAAKLHLYGKHEPRPARKMGHLTAIADNVDDAAGRARELRSSLSR